MEVHFRATKLVSLARASLACEVQLEEELLPGIAVLLDVARRPPRLAASLPVLLVGDQRGCDVEREVHIQLLKHLCAELLREPIQNGVCAEVSDDDGEAELLQGRDGGPVPLRVLCDNAAHLPGIEHGICDWRHRLKREGRAEGGGER